ncbi:cellobiohydrolase A (1,4-beta-cellobiosidase A) [Rivularia sp. PCC 7116]|uniref:glycoside hydrolase family 9 protein n=1 Tax=Rivularia sp. PCC 7116 TaxID=373994 RepID=UPI00029F1054|nr:glycoside hydrolase family 9 protein [Rivularia sp. PCC 7116]AFY57603.1 cellobiohydrolase A (1,4-beta-cellobiosidase A) [Rivularia sp. PCC 7116]
MNQNQPKFNYGEALQKSNLFYLVQRSGDLPDDYVISWRDDSAVNDGADVNRDLSGGYYDAGDHVKFGFPMAASMTMLGWGVIEYTEGYKKVGQFDNTLENIRWGTDYLLKAYDDKGTATTSDDVFWGQVGNGQIDHAYWGAPEDMTMPRPAFKVDAQNPGSDLTAESAAALASASIAFRSTDAAYADKLLEKAKGLYEFAEQYQGAYTDSITNTRSFYNSWSGYEDELAWGAVWLHKAIQANGETDSQYLDKAQNYYKGITPGWTHNWDEKSYGTAILLAQLTDKSQYKQDVEAWLDNWADPNGGIQKTAGGLAWLDQWGSLRYTANTAFLAGVYGDTVNDKQGKYTEFSESQINYILGDNPNNFSYMVGFGENYPQNPHHRAASGTTNIGDSDSNEYTLYGALVGGPSAPNDDAYQDKRTDYIANEVALDYNAAFTGALARMTEQFGGEALTEIPGINLDGSTNPNDSGGNDNPDVDNPNDSGGNDNPDVDNPNDSGGNDNPDVDNPNDSGGNDNPDVDNPNDSGGNDNPGGDNPNDSGGNDNPDGDTGTLKDVQFSVVNQWNNGFTGKIKITNNSNQAIDGWELEFNAPFEIKNTWDASIESDEGNEYVIKNLGYNRLIASGESVEFGFQGSYSGDINLAIDNVELNGTGNLSSAVGLTDSNPIVPATASDNPDESSNPIDPITGSGDNSNTDNNPTDPITSGGNPDSANEAIDNVVFSLVNQWNNGFTANVKITNNSNEVVNGWELELNTPFEIKEIWNGSIESQEGNEYLIQDVGWNASIAPGSSLEFGFNGINADAISEQDIINQISFSSDSLPISDS